MADNYNFSEGSGRTARAVDVGGALYPVHYDEARTAGGAEVSRYLDLGVTGQVCKASAGQLYGYMFHNAATATRWLKVYDKATAATEADTPKITLGLPAGQSGHIEFGKGIPLSAGISARATTGIADADTGAPGANEVSINLLWK